MFYSTDLLRRGGRFNVVWILGMLDNPREKTSKVNKKDILRVNIKTSSKFIQEHLSPTMQNSFSLRLSSVLMFGITQVLVRRARFLLADLQNLPAKYRRMKRAGGAAKEDDAGVIDFTNPQAVADLVRIIESPLREPDAGKLQFKDRSSSEFEAVTMREAAPFAVTDEDDGFFNNFGTDPQNHQPGVFDDPTQDIFGDRNVDRADQNVATDQNADDGEQQQQQQPEPSPKRPLDAQDDDELSRPAKVPRVEAETAAHEPRETAETTAHEPRFGDETSSPTRFTQTGGARPFPPSPEAEVLPSEAVAEPMMTTHVPEPADATAARDDDLLNAPQRPSRERPADPKQTPMIPNGSPTKERTPPPAFPDLTADDGTAAEVEAPEPPPPVVVQPQQQPPQAQQPEDASETSSDPSSFRLLTPLEPAKKTPRKKRGVPSKLVIDENINLDREEVRAMRSDYTDLLRPKGELACKRPTPILHQLFDGPVRDVRGFRLGRDFVRNTRQARLFVEDEQFEGQETIIEEEASDVRGSKIEDASDLRAKSSERVGSPPTEYPSLGPELSDVTEQAENIRQQPDREGRSAPPSPTTDLFGRADAVEGLAPEAAGADEAGPGGVEQQQIVPVAPTLDVTPPDPEKHMGVVPEPEPQLDVAPPEPDPPGPEPEPEPPAPEPEPPEPEPPTPESEPQLDVAPPEPVLLDVPPEDQVNTSTTSSEDSSKMVNDLLDEIHSRCGNEATRVSFGQVFPPAEVGKKFAARMFKALLFAEKQKQLVATQESIWGPILIDLK